MRDNQQNTEHQALLSALNMKPYVVEAKGFISLEDKEQVFWVATGKVHVFAWLFDSGKPTGYKKHICTLKSGDILLGSLLYQPEDTASHHYGFYAFLDHNTTLLTTQTQTFFAHHTTQVADKVNYFVSQISHTLTPTYNALHDYQHVDDSSIDVSYDKDCWLSVDTAAAVWIKVHQSGKYWRVDDEVQQTLKKNQYAAITKLLPIQMPSNHHFDIVDTQTLLSQNNLAASIEIFYCWIKAQSYQQIIKHIQQQEHDFQRVKRNQKNYLADTFHRLYNAYRGRVDITPVDNIINSGSNINSLITELCRITNIEPVLSAYQELEDLDVNNTEHIQTALNAHGFALRKVHLEKDWYKQNCWILVVTLEETGNSLLVHYDRDKYYYHDTKSDTWLAMTADIAQHLSSEAIMVYRSLPDEPITSGKSLFKQGFSLVRKDVKQVVFIGIIVAIIQLVTPVAMGNLLAESLPSYDLGAIYGYILALFASAVGVLIFQFVNSVSVLRLESKFVLDMHAAVWIRLLKLPLNFFREYSVGDLATRANIINDIRSIWSSAATSAMLSMFSLIATLGLLFYYSWHLALLALLFLVALLGAITIFIRATLPLLTESFEHKSNLNGLLYQLLNGISKLRIAAKENTALSLWSNTYARLTAVNRKFMAYNAWLQAIVQVLPLFANILVFSFIYYGLFKNGINPDFSLGDFIAFNAALGQLIGILIAIIGIALGALSTIPMTQRLLPILSEPVESNVGKTSVAKIKGDIVFNDVLFKYKDNMPIILNELSLKIKSGEYIAIVGKSGSGKSTIAKLILGFISQQSGRILIDGNDIKDLNLESLRRHIGVVWQDTGIIPGSIMENIAAGKSDLTEDDIWDALESAGIKTEIKSMPMGIHTNIAEGGAGLSGGQIQRIVVARALVSKPKMLLFDEATSSMDNISQDVVKQTLEQMNITRIVIAHRLTTIKNVDRIYVIDQGKIIESGDYDTLMALEGHFCELVKRQS